MYRFLIHIIILFFTVNISISAANNIPQMPIEMFPVQEDARVDTTNNIFKITINDAVQIENVAPVPDRIIQLKTVSLPEHETTCTIYDTSWNKIKSIDLTAYADSLIERPDTMAIEKYNSILKLIEFPLIEAHFITENEIQLSLNAPLLNSEEQEQLRSITKKKTITLNNLY